MCVRDTPEVYAQTAPSAAGGRQELFRIPLTFDGDRGGDPFDLGEIICSQVHVGSPEISSSRCSLVVPRIGTIQRRDWPHRRRGPRGAAWRHQPLRCRLGTLTMTQVRFTGMIKSGLTSPLTLTRLVRFVLVRGGGWKAYGGVLAFWRWC